MSLQNFLFKMANGGMMKSIDQLSFDHLDILLSIWHINRKSDGCTQSETEISKAFGGEGAHEFEEPCVLELFQWNILEWIREGETFRINPALDNSFQKISKEYQFMSKKGSDNEI